MITIPCFKCNRPFIPLNIVTDGMCPACNFRNSILQGNTMTKKGFQAQEYQREVSASHFAPPMNDCYVPPNPHIKANDIQHGGQHYKTMAIQPWDYITSNNLGYLEGNAVKYLSRWREKNGVEDLRKAIHYIEKLIEVETNEKQSITPPDNKTTT